MLIHPLPRNARRACSRGDRLSTPSLPRPYPFRIASCCRRRVERGSNQRGLGRHQEQVCGKGSAWPPSRTGARGKGRAWRYRRGTSVTPPFESRRKGACALWEVSTHQRVRVRVGEAVASTRERVPARPWGATVPLVALQWQWRIRCAVIFAAGLLRSAARPRTPLLPLSSAAPAGNGASRRLPRHRGRGSRTASIGWWSPCGKGGRSAERTDLRAVVRL